MLKISNNIWLCCKVFLEIPCMWGLLDDPKKKWHFSFYCIYEFVGTRGLHCMKKEKGMLGCFMFYPKVESFLSFFQHFLKCIALVLVSRNFATLKHLTHQTKHYNISNFDATNTNTNTNNNMLRHVDTIFSSVSLFMLPRWLCQGHYNWKQFYLLTSLAKIIFMQE